MMTFVRSLVLVLAVCAFAACEQQPYSKIESIENTIFHHGHAPDHGDGHAKDGHDSHGKAGDHGKKEEKKDEKSGH